jgi:site-specific recombinase XerD
VTGLLPAELDPRFEVFLAWAATQKARAGTSARRRDRFSEGTVRIYTSLWRGWVDWLGERERQWLDATHADVRAFLDGPAPAPNDRKTRRPIEAEKMANYTQQRYWSVLQAVYAHAKDNQLLEHSPCEGIDLEPQVEKLAQVRQVMLPGVLELLRTPDWVRLLLPMTRDSQWQALRDRAAVALVAHCALQTAELISLRGVDLREGDHALEYSPPPQIARSAAARRDARVDVPAQGSRPAHSIPIPGPALELLEPWLERREALLDAQHAAFVKGQLRTPPQRPAQAPVLLSREAPAGEPLPALQAQTLYLSVRKAVIAAMCAARHDPNDRYMAKGASVLRNSVIADWVEHHGPQQAAEWAGLTQVSLRARGRVPGAVG